MAYDQPTNGALGSKISESAGFVANVISYRLSAKGYDPKKAIGIVLGSGLGPLAEKLESGIEIPYSSIPNFPETTVKGHEGKLVAGFLSGKAVLAMKGRFHYYEGNSMETVVFPIRVMSKLGIKNILVTNAAGGINPELKPGDLMLITDHIKFFTESPIRGPLPDPDHTRFPDMTEAYDRILQKTAEKAADRLGIPLKKGVYFYMPGPQYETPAEIRACRILGGDAVGMSTVPEVIAARAEGMRVLGISCITNMAAGILDRPLSHQEVMDAAEKYKENFIRLVEAIVADWQV